MSAPSLSTEAAAAGNYPSRRFNKRERKLLASVKTYVDNSAPNNVITTEGDLIIGDSSGDADRLGIGAANTALLSDGTTASWDSIPAAALASVPTHYIFAAGSFTTAGGDANESITVAGALNTDIAMVVLHTKGASPETILTAQAAAGAINVEMSGDPSNDHIMRYQVLRAAL